MSIVTRFAPSPTGYLHLGHAFSALVAWRRAREAGGRFLLRLEDIDQARCRPEFAAAILEDLAWLGIEWDGEVRVQSQHFAEYRTALDALAARGLLYPCFCSRTDIHQSATAPHTPDGAPLYPGTCRALSEDERTARIAAGERYALRLNMQRALASNPPLPQAGEVGEQREPGEGMPQTFEEAGEGAIACRPEQFGDVVLARKDDTRQLPPLRHARRRRAGRDAGHAWSRPEARDPSAPAPAIADGLAGAQPTRTTNS